MQTVAWVKAVIFNDPVYRCCNYITWSPCASVTESELRRIWIYCGVSTALTKSRYWDKHDVGNRSLLTYLYYRAVQCEFLVWCVINSN
jgi:hypothetical protein